MRLRRRGIALLVVALLFLLASPALAVAPAFDAASTPTPAFDWTIGAASVTWSHTVSAAGSPLLCVAGLTAAAFTITGVTYNAVALTQVWTTTFGALRNDFWCLLNPATGAHNIVVTFSSSQGYALGGVSYTGVGSLGSSSTATGTSNTPSVAVTSAVGALVIDGMSAASSGASPTAGAGQTARVNNWDLVTGRAVSSSEEAGAASVTMSWTLTSTPAWAIGGLSLLPVSATTGPKHRAVTTP